MPRVVPPPRAETVPAVSVSDALGEALRSAAAADFAAAARALERVPPVERVAVARQFVAESLAQEPRRAAAVALELSPGPAQAAALPLAVRALLERDPQEAVNWALSQTAPGPRFVALETVASQLVARGPREAADLLLGASDAPGRVEILALALAHWSRRDPEAALAWTQRLPAGELRQRATASVGFALAQTAPERALAIIDLVSEGRDRWLLVGAIGQTWVAQNPDAAMRWARQLPAGPARDAAIAGIDAGMGIAASRRAGPAGIGGSRGPQRAGGALGVPPSLPAPETRAPALAREEALRREFEQLLQASPARAADWLSALPGPDRTDEMIARLAREWLIIDPQAAETWLDQNAGSALRKHEIIEEARQLNPSQPRLPGR
jgi:hypothetical protein